MSAASFLTILAMAAVTYATRAGGWLVYRRIEPGPRLRAWLEQLPGALFAALVAPMVVEAGPAGWLGAAGAFATMRQSGHFLLAIVVGLALYLAARPLLGS
jgi:uncharacterized membrane protein